MSNNLVGSVRGKAALQYQKPAGLAQFPQGPMASIPRQQFQLLYRELGFRQAKDVAETFIRWPHWNGGNDPAPDHLLHQWALMEDRGEAKIQAEVEAAFKRRWKNYADAMALAHFSVNTNLVKKYATMASKLLDDAAKGEFDERAAKFVKEMTPVLQHANMGGSFIFREYKGARGEKSPQGTVINGNVRVITNRPPTKISNKRIAKEIPAVVGEFRELPSGS